MDADTLLNEAQSTLTRIKSFNAGRRQELERRERELAEARRKHAANERALEAEVTKLAERMDAMLIGFLKKIES